MPWGHMMDVRNLIIQGIRDAVPQTQLYLRQGKGEGPTKFLERLRAQIKKYGGIDSTNPSGKNILKPHFVTNSWPNISK